MPRRPDAELLKTSKFHELQFHIMRERNESTIYFDTQIDLTRTIEFLEEYNKNRKEEDKITLFELYLTAGVRAITLRPKINRFTSGRRLWQRNQIIISFVVKKEKTEEGEEVNAMIEFDPFDTLETVHKRVSNEIYEARFGENKNEKDIKLFGSMPRWLIKFIFWFTRWMDHRNRPLYFLTKDIPFWGTAYVAHLGSLGIDSVFHHNYELGTVGIFITVGKMHKASILNQETDELEIKTVMNVKISIDDRIADGSYTGPTIYFLKDLIENPEPLVNPPDLTDEQLDKLMLKKYKKERLQREKEKKKQNKLDKKKKK
ncbi:MAG TPA: 2-oxo acid dehydrogenase subunit E2 [candidate division Zixibacteria bacterium]|nr:2-oxo acid dehydrogenase subunit E2 [candidate division Zixibacteria bacterium]